MRETERALESNRMNRIESNRIESNRIYLPHSNRSLENPVGVAKSSYEYLIESKLSQCCCQKAILTFKR